MKTCSVENCKNKHSGLGYCKKHYKRFKRYGDPLLVKKVVGEERSNHPLYRTYKGIKDRCLNPKGQCYKDYGGRGITICDRWLGIDGFANFIHDVVERPTKKHTIDRVDNDKGYSPDNFRWATKLEQNLNRRDSSKHPYVSFNKGHKKWVVQKSVDGKKKHFGVYATQEAAIDATIKLGFVIK